MIRMGLIGAGRMGAVHARHAASLPGVELTRVVDLNANAAEQLAAPHDAKAGTMPSEILGDGDAAATASAQIQCERQSPPMTRPAPASATARVASPVSASRISPWLTTANCSVGTMNPPSAPCPS